jgi:hypothetical protein
MIIYFYRENKNDENDKSEEEIKKIAKELYSLKNTLHLKFKQIISFYEPFYTLIAFVELFIFWKISKLFNDKLIILLVGNVIIFYSFIEKKYPRFLFRCRMFVKQIIEGIISSIITFIPKYEEIKNEQES